MTTTFKKDDVTKKGVHSDLNTDEQVFVEFLQKNPEHTLSTTEVYKQIGLSARKGTNAKKNLEQKGLIKIEEVKYNKGWKKLIRLSN
jgi:predicted transcriptional regulator